MADENGTPSDATNEPLANGEDTSPQVGMITQYTKDLSFENPSTPGVFQWQSQPQIDVQFNISADKHGDDLHEVVLKIDVKSTADEGTQFIVDLSYAGLFGVRNVSDEQLHPFLYAEAPRILFPFARRVLADAIRDGGFPPLLLEPIDFGTLYAQQRAAQAQGGEATDQPVGTA
ncbi:MAG: protein-export chaperone SecB [Sphingomonadales bacterium]|nr:protein-export chaperone SecB [Sphingomonadales bacterium]